MRTRIIGVGACVLLGVMVAGQARAQTTDDTEKYIRVVQQKPFMKALRAEVAPTFYACLNETLTSHLGVGAVARFHITDEWAVGLDYVKYFGRLSTLAADVGNEFDVYPEKRLMDFFAGAHVTYAPILGKFLLFNGPVIYWDLYLLAGIGMTRTGADANRATGDLGLGVRFGFLQFMSLNLEVRDFLYQDEFQHTKEFVNNIAFTAGLGFFLPFTHDFVYPK